MGSTLLWAIKNGDLDEVKEHVDKDKKVVNSELDGRSPLHHAADYGQTGIIEFLLARGSKIDAEDKFGITPLLAAVFEGHTSGVLFLLSKGANKNGKSPDGRSYYECAEKDDIRNALN